MNKDQPSRAAGQIKVDLGVDLKASWYAWCAERAIVPSKALRGLVERTLQAGEADPLAAGAAPAKPVPTVRLEPQPDTGPREGREIYFTPSEQSSIEVIAAAQGFGFHEWVIAAVRSALKASPAYGQAEIEALVQSNRQLAQAVLELKRLREAGDSDAIRDNLMALEVELRQHVEKVSRVLAQGARRWQLSV